MKIPTPRTSPPARFLLLAGLAFIASHLLFGQPPAPAAGPAAAGRGPAGPAPTIVGDGRGGTVTIAPAGRGGRGGGRGGPAPVFQPTINLETLTATRALTPEQLAQAKPLYDEIAAKQAELSALNTALPGKLTALATEEQRLPVSLVVGTFNDQQHQMKVLGIKALRPGKSGSNQTGPGFDLATANPWKDSMPALMKMQDGTAITRAAQWPARRAELVELFEREMYGRIPAAARTIKIDWQVTAETKGTSASGIPTITRTLVGTVDNSSYPALTVALQASYTIPANATGPVPVMIGFGGGANSGGGEQALLKGWGSGGLNPTSFQADGGAGLTSGIIGLINKGQPRTGDQWGALRAWGWGLSRLVDYFEQHPETGVDASKIGITGVSRYGKAALVAQAFDERVAVGLIGSSGAGGAKLNRHDFGEALENLTGGEYYWFCGNFMKYGAAEATFGSKNAADLPIDAHQFIALCAPRPCFISYGVEAAGDPKWVGAPGSYMAGILASPAYELLGKKGYGVKPEDYITAPMPAVGQLVGGELAWRQHEGGHTQVPNFPAFYEWIGTYIKAPAARK